MEASPSLPTLPVELIDTIGECCDNSSFLALRATCKDVSAALFRAFIAAYISKRSHLYTTFGVQKLVKITADAHLGTHITLTKESFKLSPGIGERWSQEMKALQKGDVAAGLLSYIFANLAAASRELTLTITGIMPDEDGRNAIYINLPYGAARLTRQLGLDGPAGEELGNGSMHACGQAVRAIMQASSMDDAPVKALDFGGPEWHGFSIHGHAFLSIDNLNVMGHGSWRSLEMLKLDFGTHEVFANWSARQRVGLRRLIESAPGLEQISIRFTDHRASDLKPFHESLRRLKNAFVSARPQDLELHRVHGLIDLYQRTLKKMSPTLRLLTLNEATIRDPAGWKDMLRLVVRDLELEHLELRGLKNEVAQPSARFWRNHNTYDYVGEDVSVEGNVMDVRDRIVALADEME